MKTNFLSRDIPLMANRSLLRCGIFIMFLLGSTLSVHAQKITLYPPIFNGGTLNPCENPPLLGQEYPTHWLLNLNETGSNTTVSIVSEPLNDYGVYSNSFEGMVNLTSFNPFNPFNPSNSFNPYQPYFHLQIVLQSDDEPSDAFFKFGFSGKRSYSVHDGKLFYNTGHVNLEPCDVIDLYYRPSNGGHYELRKNSVTLECGTIESSRFSIGLSAFVKAQNRPNDNNGVFAMFRRLSYVNMGSCAPDCSSDYDVGDLTDFRDILSTGIACPPQERETYEVQGYLTAYPNPTSEQLTVSLNPPADETLTINIVDAMGKTVQYQQESVFGQADNTFHLNTSQLPSGIYYIMIDSAYRFETQKVTIIK